MSPGAALAAANSVGSARDPQIDGSAIKAIWPAASSGVPGHAAAGSGVGVGVFSAVAISRTEHKLGRPPRRHAASAVDENACVVQYGIKMSAKRESNMSGKSTAQGSAFENSAQ